MMKKNWDKFTTLAQEEALLNELKGNLFEFLLGLKIATKHECQEQFFRDFHPSYRETLSAYETWLRQKRPHLAIQLPLLAEASFKEVARIIDFKVQEVKLTGRLAKEADIVLAGKEKSLTLSLKLCKKGSFVNTKSGGIFSFVSKYFSPLYREEASVLQEQLNKKTYMSFHQMGLALYEAAGLDKFEGEFTEEWDERGFGHLPGQLPHHLKEIVFKHYQRVIGELYRIFKILLARPTLFSKALGPIMGLTSPEVNQLLCFHKGTDNYQLAGVKIFAGLDLEKLLSSMQLNEYRGFEAGFEIALKGRVVQIRVKPMNKFTVMGLKVNCSIKDKDEKLSI